MLFYECLLCFRVVRLPPGLKWDLIDGALVCEELLCQSLLTSQLCSKAVLVTSF